MSSDEVKKPITSEFKGLHIQCHIIMKIIYSLKGIIFATIYLLASYIFKG